MTSPEIPDEFDPGTLQEMYRARFSDTDRIRINNFWDLLFTHTLDAHIPAEGTVLDLGAGSCEFINRVSAGRRIAVDLNPDTATAAAPGVEVVLTRSDDLAGILDSSVDLVFTSNFFEHLRTPDELLATLAECHRVLRPGGRIVVLMPNLRAVGPKYFDYLDHTLPVTDRSLTEALGLTGFRTLEVIARFLPYGVNPAGRIPSDQSARSPLTILSRPEIHKRALRAYLAIKPLWRAFGGQMLVVAERPKPGQPKSPTARTTAAND